MQRPYRPTNVTGASEAGLQPGSLLRRLREEPRDAINRIAGEIGARRATSLGEAQAAAYLDGRLRRAGLRVSAEGFRAPAGIGWDGVALALDIDVNDAGLGHVIPQQSAGGRALRD